MLKVFLCMSPSDKEADNVFYRCPFILSVAPEVRRRLSSANVKFIVVFPHALQTLVMLKAFPKVSYRGRSVSFPFSGNHGYMRNLRCYLHYVYKTHQQIIFEWIVIAVALYFTVRVLPWYIHGKYLVPTGK